MEELRRDAEAQYRAKEQQLQQRLKELQQQLQGIQPKGEAQSGEVILSAEDKANIERFRGEMLKVRKELRDVQHACAATSSVSSSESNSSISPLFPLSCAGSVASWLSSDVLGVRGPSARLGTAETQLR